MTQKWTQDELAILEAYYGVLDVNKLQELLPCRSKYSIPLKARSIGLVGNPSLTRKYINVDLDFFEIPTVINSYWAGFIAADGNIHKDKNCVRIKISSIDKTHLERFVKDCNFEGEIRISEKGPGFGDPTALAAILSISGVKKWKNDLLQNYRITPNKTLSLQPPTSLNFECTLAFITGYIDGDGCVHKIKQKNRTIPSIQVTGTVPFLSWVKDFCDRFASCPTKRPSSIVKCTNSKAFSYKISGMRALKMFDLVNALDMPKLERKWRIFSDA